MIKPELITFQRDPFFKLAREQIKPESVVLDIGAGNGSFSKYCNRNDFYLFDGNSKSVDLLKANYKNVHLGNLPHLPYEASFFDVIHCSHVVEHLEPQILYKTLEEIDRCLKSDGYLVISAPLMWEGFYSDLSHIRPYNTTVFTNYLCDNKSDWRTREKISSTYIVEKLIYRYREINLLEDIENSRNGFLVNKLLKMFKFLQHNGLKKYEKTGYTIVLRK